MSCSAEYNDGAAVQALIQENHDLRQQTEHYREQMTEALQRVERMERDLVAAMEAAMEAKRHAR